MRVRITVTKALPTGIVPVTVAGDPVEGHLLANAGRTILFARNDDAAQQTVTVLAPGSVGGGIDVPDQAIAVAAGDTTAIGPLDPIIFNRSADPDAGEVYVDVLVGEPRPLGREAVSQGPAPLSCGRR